jgi:hypothetical protein
LVEAIREHKKNFVSILSASAMSCDFI